MAQTVAITFVSLLPASFYNFGILLLQIEKAQQPNLKTLINETILKMYYQCQEFAHCFLSFNLK